MSFFPFKWLWLQEKRLFRRPAFLALLLALPLFALLTSAMSGAEEGFLTVALCPGDGALAEPLRQTSLLRFLCAEDEHTATAMVRAGEADAAWILPQNLSGALTAFFEEGEPVVRVVQREETVPLRLARERLAAALFTPAAREVYLSTLRDALPAARALPDEELLRPIEQERADDLFAFQTLSASGEAEPARETGYLLSPVRGFLSMLIALSGPLAGIFALRDERGGIASLLPPRARPPFALANCLLVSVNLGGAALLSLYLSGLGGFFPQELSAMLLLCLLSAASGALLAFVLPRGSALAASLPLLAVAMLALCPIFFPAPRGGALALLSRLLPPTPYLSLFTGGAWTGLLTAALSSLALALSAAALRARAK